MLPTWPRKKQQGTKMTRKSWCGGRRYKKRRKLVNKSSIFALILSPILKIWNSTSVRRGSSSYGPVASLRWYHHSKAQWYHYFDSGERVWYAASNEGEICRYRVTAWTSVYIAMELRVSLRGILSHRNLTNGIRWWRFKSVQTQIVSEHSQSCRCFKKPWKSGNFQHIF